MRYSKTAKRLSSALALLALLCVAEAAPAAELQDATGALLTLAPSPRRIVALAPSLAELAADLSGGDFARIVGVSDYSDYPRGVEKIPSVGSYARFNLEKVAALTPDLVLATIDGNPKDQVLHLRELGLRVIVIDTSSFGKVPESIRLLGRAMGEEARAEELAKKLEAGILNIRNRAEGRPNLRVLLQVGDDPLVVAGKDSFLNGAIEAIGARNLGESGRYPRPSREQVLQQDPDAIIVMALGKDIAPYEKMARRWSEFRNLKAVRTGKVRVLRADPLLRPTQRLLAGIEALEKAVYGAE